MENALLGVLQFDTKSAQRSFKHVKTRPNQRVLFLFFDEESRNFVIIFFREGEEGPTGREEYYRWNRRRILVWIILMDHRRLDAVLHTED